MPITREQYTGVYRKFEFPVTFLEHDQEKLEKLNIKYRPVTQQWLDEWAAITKRFDKDLSAQSEQAVDSAYEAVRTLVDGSSNGDAPQNPQEKAFFLATLYALIQSKTQLTDEQKEEKKRLTANQLATILIDIDFVEKDAQGNAVPVKPTADFLYTFDLEFLSDVGEEILKKTFRMKTT